MKFFNMNLLINHPQHRFTIGFTRDRDDLIRLFFGYGKMDPAAGPRVGRSNFGTRMNSASWTNFGGLGALGLGDTAVFGKVKSHTISKKNAFWKGSSHS